MILVSKLQAQIDIIHTKYFSENQSNVGWNIIHYGRLKAVHEEFACP
jgi:hypothetical protein